MYASGILSAFDGTGSGSGWTPVFWALSRNKSNQAMDTVCPGRTQADRVATVKTVLLSGQKEMHGARDSVKLKIYICLHWYNGS